LLLATAENRHNKQETIATAIDNSKNSGFCFYPCNIDSNVDSANRGV